MTSNYPGTDPDDPFAKPPNETVDAERVDLTKSGPTTEETAPIRPGDPGYWEKLAQQGQAGHQQPPSPSPAAGENPWAAHGQPPPAGPVTYQGQPYPPPPPYAYAQPAYSQPAYAGYVQPQQPQATTAMVLGLVSLVGGFLTCGALFLMAPFAWVVGAKSKREINASNGQLGGGGNAQAGFVMGIIGTVLLVLLIVVVVLIVVIAINSGSTTYDSGTNF